MKNLLIGSRALGYWLPEFKVKNEADWDVITDKEIPGIEKHEPEFLDNYRFEEYTTSDKLLYNGHWLYPVSLNGLAIIKRSHLWRDVGFDKHITMYHRHLSKYCPNDSQFLKYRTALTLDQFSKVKPNFKTNKKKFFNGNVTRKYDHDFLHTLVKHGNEPVYKKLQKPGNDVFCNRDLWYNLSFADQVNCVTEEAYVIAIERFLVPSGWEIFPKAAFHKSLNKICTTMTSGWFRDFAIDFYPAIHDNFNVKFLQQARVILEKELTHE